MEEKIKQTRNIGVNVNTPKETCKDKNCPFHGTLPVRGQIITGVVSSIKMQDSILVKRELKMIELKERIRKLEKELTAISKKKKTK